MGIASIGIPGLILIVVVALIIFGPSKLPEIGKATGDTLKAFKSSVNDKNDHEGDEKIEQVEESNPKEK